MINIISNTFESITKNIVISGATSELAVSLMNEINKRCGYKIVLLSRKEITKTFSAKNEIKKITTTSFLSQDFRNKLHIEARKFFLGPFSILHFVGEFWEHSPFCDTDFEKIESMIESHYLTLCSVTMALTPAMKEKGGGRLIAFSCNSVSFNYPDMSPFTSAKAAVECFIKCYSNEHSKFNITATALALPTMNTEGVRKVKNITTGDAYVKPEELSCILLDEILIQNKYLTGNIHRLIKYNDAFYNKSYFERNPSKKLNK